MTYIMADVEADGPIPGDYSMVSFGAIVVESSLDRTFYGRIKPISDKWIPEVLQVSGFTREETLAFDDPKMVMERFADWIRSVCQGQPMFLSEVPSFRQAWAVEKNVRRIRGVRNPGTDSVEKTAMVQETGGAEARWRCPRRPMKPCDGD